MISRISGILKEQNGTELLIGTNGIAYQVSVPESVLNHLLTESKLQLDEPITLVTYHYYQNEPSRSFPVLIGFSNQIERDFFEKFITVSGVGPKAAVRALSVPISTIARAIDLGDVSVLKSLPGIGQQRAKDIIARLQGKVGKYVLLKDDQTTGQVSVESNDIASEAMEVLLQLQYSRQEAEKMLSQALERNQEIKTIEDLLNEVYKQKALV